MSDGSDERTPLLQVPGSFPDGTESNVDLSDSYQQFCHLVGNRPNDWPKDRKFKAAHDTLYARATHHRTMQGYTYAFTAATTNTLLLTQVVLGAALTGLGASGQSHVLITVFGAMNTVIAGVIAFLKSRGQPMRARMFRDDLDRVVDEIENSATMWLGISKNVHGYDAIDTEQAVTVRSEVARLTRLYDRAVKINTLNDPDFYGAGAPSDPHSATLKAHAGQAAPAPAPSSTPAGPAAAAPAGPSVVVSDEDESPATKAKPEPSKDDDKDKAVAPQAATGAAKPEDASKANAEDSAACPTPATKPPASAAAAAIDPDESPATAVDSIAGMSDAKRHTDSVSAIPDPIEVKPVGGEAKAPS